VELRRSHIFVGLALTVGLAAACQVLAPRLKVQAIPVQALRRHHSAVGKPGCRHHPFRRRSGADRAAPPSLRVIRIHSSMEWLLVLTAIGPCGRQDSADEVADFVAFDAGTRVEHLGVPVAVQSE
jgi:hypothetical protein